MNKSCMKPKGVPRAQRPQLSRFTKGVPAKGLLDPSLRADGGLRLNMGAIKKSISR